MYNKDFGVTKLVNLHLKNKFADSSVDFATCVENQV